jgi:peptidoglycan/LPS O-acetylase OafA/YrhL
LGRHTSPPADTNPIAQAFAAAWCRGGWVGVDLFFVLSGFLIAGLLFREYDQYGTISLRRFFIRRGLKIYPAFYVFFLLTLLGRWLRGEILMRRPVVSEALFIQNYGGALWGHTWSLAVEEHFYFLLPLVLLFMARRRASGNPFRTLPYWVAGICTTLLLLKLANACYYPEQIARSYQIPLLVIGIGLFIPAFFIELNGSFFLHTLGLSCSYLGAGMILSVSLLYSMSSGVVFQALNFVGARSYSIYLWHVLTGMWLIAWVKQQVTAPVTPWFWIGLFVISCVVVGSVFAWIVEYPVLRLRDRLCPPRTKTLSVQVVGSKA